MKKYTHYRVGLFIGLFCLSTLSACVNTREALGGGSQESQQGWSLHSMPRFEIGNKKIMMGTLCSICFTMLHSFTMAEMGQYLYGLYSGMANSTNTQESLSRGLSSLPHPYPNFWQRW